MPRPSSSLSITHSMNGTSSPPVGTRQIAGLMSRQRSSSVLSAFSPNFSSMNLAERGDDISSASEIEDTFCLGASREVRRPVRLPPPRAVTGLPSLSPGPRVVRAAAEPVFFHREMASELSLPRCASRGSACFMLVFLPPFLGPTETRDGDAVSGSSVENPPALCSRSLR